MKYPLLLFLIAFSLNAFPQKLISKIAKQSCDCIMGKAKTVDVKSKDFVTECMEEIMEKNEKALKKEYGDEVFEDFDDELTEFGVALGKTLIKECPNFMDLVLELQESEMQEAEDYYQRGENLLNAEEYDKSIEAYSTAISMDVTNHKYINARGLAYLYSDMAYEAIADFIRAIEHNPDYVVAHFNLAHTKNQLNDLEGAQKSVNKALAVDENHCKSQNLNGLLFYKNQQYDSAKVWFEKASYCDTSNRTFAFNLAMSYYEGQEYKDAIPLFEKAYSMDSTIHSVLSYIGNCYFFLGNYVAALKIHNQHVEGIDGGDYVSLYNRGTAHYELDDYESAIIDFQAAYTFDSTDVDLIVYLAETYESMEDLEMAGTYYNLAQELNPSDATYYDLRAAYYEKTEEYEKAILDYNISLSLYPNDCEIHRKLGELYAKVNKPEKSKRSYAKSKEMGCKFD